MPTKPQPSAMRLGLAMCARKGNKTRRFGLLEFIVMAFMRYLDVNNRSTQSGAGPPTKGRNVRHAVTIHLHHEPIEQKLIKYELECLRLESMIRSRTHKLRLTREWQGDILSVTLQHSTTQGPVYLLASENSPYACRLWFVHISISLHCAHLHALSFSFSQMLRVAQFSRNGPACAPPSLHALAQFMWRHT